MRVMAQALAATVPCAGGFPPIGIMGLIAPIIEAHAKRRTTRLIQPKIRWGFASDPKRQRGKAARGKLRFQRSALATRNPKS